MDNSSGESQNQVKTLPHTPGAKAQQDTTLILGVDEGRGRHRASEHSSLPQKQPQENSPHSEIGA